MVLGSVIVEEDLVVNWKAPFEVEGSATAGGG